MSLLDEAGLTEDDFVSLRSVVRSEFTGRIIVTVGGSLLPQPIDQQERTNLVAVLREPGESRYVFNPLKWATWPAEERLPDFMGHAR